MATHPLGDMLPNFVLQLSRLLLPKYLYHNQENGRRGQKVDRALQVDRFQGWGMGLLADGGRILRPVVVMFLSRLVVIIARFQLLRFLIVAPSRLNGR
jgi:hypothetical protein